MIKNEFIVIGVFFLTVVLVILGDYIHTRRCNKKNLHQDEWKPLNRRK